MLSRNINIMSTDENSESASASEREWSLEPETTTSKNPVAQKQQETQLAQQEERRMKVVLQEKQEDLYNATQNDNGPSYDPLVKVCWGIALVLLILLICHISIRFLNIHSDDFDAVLLSGDHIARFRALKEHNIQNLQSLFTIVLSVVLLAFFSLFGSFVHFSNAKTHESRKRGDIMRKVVNVFQESTGYISLLNRDLGSQEMKMKQLTSSANKLENDIKELKKNDKENAKQIKYLEREKAEVGKEITKTKENLKNTETTLNDAKDNLQKLQKKAERKDKTVDHLKISKVRLEIEKKTLEQQKQKPAEQNSSCIIS